MSWVRDFNGLALLLYGALTLAWAAGGWLLVCYVFRLPAHERPMVGLALGWMLFIAISNLLAPLVGLPLGYAVASLLILASAGLMVWGSPIRRAQLGESLPLGDFRHWRSLLVLALLAALFTAIGRGLAIFDDYLHLPMVSVMGTGDIPPHFYFDPAQKFAYHYGLQVWSASLVQIAGFFPWTAWDLGKGISIAFVPVLGWLWLLRMVRSRTAAALGAVALTLAQGARWLMLFLPAPLLARIQSNLVLLNTGVDTATTSLAQGLAGPWIAEGTGLMPYPFAYLSGIFPPVIAALGATGATPYLTILLLLMLFPTYEISLPGAAVLSLLLASLALNAEHVFAFLWLGLAFVIVAAFVRARRMQNVPARAAVLWAGALAVSALLSLVQGGFITEAARGVLAALNGVGAASTNAYPFTVRWPPAVYSAHLGVLSLFNPYHWLVLLFELGPVLILAPAATWFAWRRFRDGGWLLGGLAVSAVVSFIFPIFFQYGVDRSITRLAGTSMWVWLLLGIPVVWQLWVQREKLRWLIGTAYGVMVFGGIVLLAVQMVSISNPHASYFIAPVDVEVSRAYWGRLEPGAQVLDAVQERAVTVFGRPVTAFTSIYVPMPVWSELAGNPDPAQAARAGFSYIYVDNWWWNRLSEEARHALQQPCVNQVGETWKWENDFRMLLDVSACK